jgi:hypothetical protein
MSWEEANLTQPAGPDSADWQRRWTIDAGSVTLQPVTRRTAQAVLDGGPITSTFEEGALHDRIPQAMGVAMRDIDSGAAAVLPTVWLIVRSTDGRIIGDIGTHGLPDREGCVEIGYALLAANVTLGTSSARNDRGQVAQRVVEMVWGERRELNVLAGHRPDRRPVIGECHLGLVRAERGQVVAPDPAAEL